MKFIQGIWTDDMGRSAEMGCYGEDNAAAASIIGTAYAFSQAVNTKMEVTEVFPGFGASANTGPYLSVEEVADLQFTNHDSGGVFHLLLPAPYQGIFMLDSETVDPTVIADLIAVMILKGLMPSGSPIDTYIKGYRRFITRGRMQQ